MQVSTKTPLHTTHFIAVIYFTTSALEDVHRWFSVDTELFVYALQCLTGKLKVTIIQKAQAYVYTYTLYTYMHVYIYTYIYPLLHILMHTIDCVYRGCKGW